MSKLPRGMRRGLFSTRVTALALLALAGCVYWTSGPAAPRGTTRRAPIAAKASGSLPEAARTTVPSRVGDTIVVLKTEAGRSAVQELLVAPGEQVTSRPERLLPVIPGGYYSGPVAMSSTACVVIGCRAGPSGQQEITAYQYQLPKGNIATLGTPVQARPGELTLCLLSSSPLSGDVVVAMTSPEIVQDAPWTWTPGTDRWQRLGDAYPALRKVVGKPSEILTAAFSPDGSLLAVAVQYEDEPGAFDIWTYHVRTRRLRKLARVHHGIWVRLALSGSNSDLLWEDLQGFGMITLASCRSRYWPGKELKGLPNDSATTQGAFASDGKHVYFIVRFGMGSFEPSLGRYVSTWVASFDPSSGSWQVIWKEEPGTEVAGMAVLPTATVDASASPPP